VRDGDVRPALQARLPQLRLPPRLLGSVNGSGEDERMWENMARRLEGSIVVLEPLEFRHEQDLFEAASDLEIWHWMPYNAIETPESFHTWFEDAVAVSKAGTQVAFAILDARTGAPIGSTRYLALRPEHRGLEIGWTWLTRSAWGMGANVEVKLLLLEHAFERLGCQRVEFLTDARNERSRAALAALPARFEGILRKHRLVPRLRDSACYSIIDEEWLEVRANLRRRLKG
jgi:RimJ/RimL family protein N-acetyltransferase